MASVDDIDELIATRRLNGVDDGLFNENDKNVVNMTEEAFNEIIDNLEVVAYLTEYGRRGIKENVKKLQARIKDLEKENKNKDTYIKMAKEVIENSILIDKIKNKIDDLKEQRRKLGFKTYLRREDMLNDDKAIVNKISALEELLEEK